MTISAMPKSSRMFFVLSMMLLSGCATVMLQYKVDPSRSFTHTGTAPLDYVSFETVNLYTEKRLSIAKRGGYRVVALAAGVGIDHLIISQSWSGGAKVFAELATGYAIGCWGEDPRRSTLC